MRKNDWRGEVTRCIMVSGKEREQMMRIGFIAKSVVQHMKLYKKYAEIFLHERMTA